MQVNVTERRDRSGPLNLHFKVSILTLLRKAGGDDAAIPLTCSASSGPRRLSVHHSEGVQFRFSTRDLAFRPSSATSISCMPAAPMRKTTPYCIRPAHDESHRPYLATTTAQTRRRLSSHRTPNLQSDQPSNHLTPFTTLPGSNGVRRSRDPLPTGFFEKNLKRSTRGWLVWLDLLAQEHDIVYRA